MSKGKKKLKAEIASLRQVVAVQGEHLSALVNTLQDVLVDMYTRAPTATHVAAREAAESRLTSAGTSILEHRVAAWLQATSRSENADH